MKRVLKDGGRAVVSTWQPLPRHEFFSALHSSMEERLGTAAAATPFTLGDTNELGGLVRDAGFENVAVEDASLVAVYPDPERFLDETIDALMAVVVSMLDIPEQQLAAGVSAIKRDLQDPLNAHTEGDRILLPWHANIAKAVA